MSGLNDACRQLSRVRRATDKPNFVWPGTRTKYVYDANGNMTSRQGSSISWSSYNYPTLINDTATGESVSFAYGPDRRAWLEQTQGPSGTETTYHVGGLLDIVSSGGVVDYRHYIYAGSEPVAIDSRKSSGANAFYYLLSDQEGSITAITNSAGGVVVGESFTAYGNRRNPTTWSGAPTSSDLTTIAGITRHGFTFQDALGSMGLNDMVGRVQDAITGRFLSADPIVQDPTDPQDYNSYSYTVNNPLTYSDPSGFDYEDDHTDDGTGFLMGGGLWQTTYQAPTGNGSANTAEVIPTVPVSNNNSDEGSSSDQLGSGGVQTSINQPAGNVQQQSNPSNGGCPDPNACLPESVVTGTRESQGGASSYIDYSLPTYYPALYTSRGIPEGEVLTRASPSALILTSGTNAFHVTAYGSQIQVVLSNLSVVPALAVTDISFQLDQVPPISLGESEADILTGHSVTFQSEPYGVLGGPLQVIVTVEVETDGAIVQAEIHGIGAPGGNSGGH